MKISGLHLKGFRRFLDCRITNIPVTAKLVVLAGPNGTGKTSVFDAILLSYRSQVGYGWTSDNEYYANSPERSIDPSSITINLHEEKSFARGSLYLRTAHRHDPEFIMNSLSRQGNVLDNTPVDKFIKTDSTVASNYARLAAQAMEDLFVKSDSSMTIGQYHDELIGEIRDPLLRLFPDLVFTGIGNPLNKGTFRFNKGPSIGFDYRNLSSGEKAAFDLILDLVIKRSSYPDAVYCIDEPETHINTSIQGRLLEELVNLVPDGSQLWISSHSIGMMRRAVELHRSDPGRVVFLDFAERNFDEPTIVEPSPPSRAFWQSVLHVALHDLAALVAPRELVVCEGRPGTGVGSANHDFDASIYTTIFEDSYPDVKFVSGGGANQVASDYFGFIAAFPKVAPGILVQRLIDKDDQTPQEIATKVSEGIRVLSRRTIESYLYDDEILSSLCASHGQPEKAVDLLAAKESALRDSVGRGYPTDDVKAASRDIYLAAKRLLGLTGVGNDSTAFARYSLAPLILPSTQVYSELESSIFPMGR